MPFGIGFKMLLLVASICLAGAGALAARRTAVTFSVSEAVSPWVGQAIIFGCFFALASLNVSTGLWGLAFVSAAAKINGLHRSVLPNSLVGRLNSMCIPAVTFALAHTFLLTPFKVPSESMEPAFKPGDIIIVSKLGRNHGSFLGGYAPERGEVVVFRGSGWGEYLVKRVVGLPGDRIRLEGKTLILNGKVIPELSAELDLSRGRFQELGKARFEVLHDAARPWMDLRLAAVMSSSFEYQVTGATFETQVPADMYFVMGDNREHSVDSRYFGSVARSSIVGPVLWKVRFP